MKSINFKNYLYVACAMLLALMSGCKTQKKTTHTVKVFDTTYSLPTGWHRSGSSPYRYAMGIDKGAGHAGGNAATVKCITTPNGFGTLMQTCAADRYLGKKIKLSGYLKSKDVTRWAAFWLRVDDSVAKKSVAFDNMSDRPIRGNTDWRKYEIVLSVPARADKIAYGALLDGDGQIWFDQMNMEIVGDDAITTRGSQNEPVNMSFDK